MSSKKLWLTGIGSFWPFVILPTGIMIVAITSAFLGPYPHELSDTDGAKFIIIITLMTLLFMSFIIAPSVIIYFIYDTFNNPFVKKKDRVTWLVLLYLLGVFTCPFYWFINIFKHRNEDIYTADDMSIVQY